MIDHLPWRHFLVWIWNREFYFYYHQRWRIKGEPGNHPPSGRFWHGCQGWQNLYFCFEICHFLQSRCIENFSYGNFEKYCNRNLKTGVRHFFFACWGDRKPAISKRQIPWYACHHCLLLFFLLIKRAHIVPNFSFQIDLGAIKITLAKNLSTWMWDYSTVLAFSMNSWSCKFLWFDQKINVFYN